MPHEEHGYIGDKRYIDEKLIELTTAIDALRKEVGELKIDVNTLKIKAATWGAIVSAGITLGIKYLVR